MSWEKAYQPIDWANGTTPALNETNLGAIDSALTAHDDRIIELQGIGRSIQDYVEEVEGMVEDVEDLKEECDADVVLAKQYRDESKQDYEEVEADVDSLKEDMVEQSASLDALWKLSKGQIWDFYTESKTSHVDTVTSGGRYASFDVLGCLSQRATVDGVQILQTNPIAEVVSVSSTSTELDRWSIPSASMTELVAKGYGMGVSSTCYNYLEFADDGKVYLHKKVADVDLGSLSFGYESAISCFYSSAISDAKGQANGVVGNLLCSMYNTSSVSNVAFGGENKAVGINTDKNLYIRDSSYTDASAFKTAMNGVKLHYELATEQIIDVTDLVTPKTLTCEGGGSMTYNGTDTSIVYGVPHTLTYIRKLSEVQ